MDEICRNCKYWEAECGWEREIDLDYPTDCTCNKLKEILEFDYITIGWDGSSEVDQIWTKPEWGCKSFEVYIKE